MPCPLCNVYSSGWILSILGTKSSPSENVLRNNDLRPWYISSRSFRHDFAIKLLKYVHPAWLVCSVMSTVLDGFFPYYAQMINSIRGCVAHNDIWPGPISSRRRVGAWVLGTHTRSTWVPNFSMRTQTTGNISTRGSTQHQSTQYLCQYWLSTSSECQWFSLNSWNFLYHSLQIECYHLMNCLLIRWNSS